MTDRESFFDASDSSDEVIAVRVVADTSDFDAKLRDAGRIGRQFSTTLVRAFEGVAVKGKSLSEVFRSVALSLSQIVLRTALKPLELGLGGLVQGLISGVTPFAKGGVIQSATPVPFAKGGVIASPIAFPLVGGATGIAGERGAEAIMPLSRGSDGRLGVVARQATAPNITINVAAQDVESFRRSETQIAAILSRMSERGQRNL